MHEIFFLCVSNHFHAKLRPKTKCLETKLVILVNFHDICLPSNSYHSASVIITNQIFVSNQHPLFCACCFVLIHDERFNIYKNSERKHQGQLVLLNTLEFVPPYTIPPNSDNTLGVFAEFYRSYNCSFPTIQPLSWAFGKTSRFISEVAPHYGGGTY